MSSSRARDTTARDKGREARPEASPTGVPSGEARPADGRPDGLRARDEDPPRGSQPAATPGALRRSRGESIGAAVGSFLGGIEQQVFHRRPPGIELVREAQPVRGTTADGVELTIEMPPSDTATGDRPGRSDGSDRSDRPGRPGRAGSRGG